MTLSPVLTGHEIESKMFAVENFCQQLVVKNLVVLTLFNNSLRFVMTVRSSF